MTLKHRKHAARRAVGAAAWAGTFGWASFLGFSGILCLTEGIALIFKSKPVQQARLDTLIATAYQSLPVLFWTVMAGLVFLVAAFAVLGVQRSRLKAAPKFDLDIAIGFVGLLFTSLVTVASLGDYWFDGLGTIGLGVAGISLTAWSIYRAFKKTKKLPSATRANQPIGSRRPPIGTRGWVSRRTAASQDVQAPPARALPSKAILPIAVVSVAACWVLYRNLRQN